MPSDPAESLPLTSLFGELRRRRVFRTAVLYLIIAWGVLEVWTTVAPLLGVPDWSTRLVLGLLSLGFPLAVGWAWILEPTTEGARFASALVVAAATAMGLGVVALVFLRPAESGSGPVPTGAAAAHSAGGATESDRTVAVHPFLDLGADAASAYFGAGVSEQIVTVLARFEDIRVVAGSGDAGYTLEGTVRRAGDRVRISARLSAAGSGAVTWAEDYDRDLTLDDILAIQSDVAESVALALQSRMARALPVAPGRRPTESLDAYDSFLRGNYELSRRTPASVTRAIAEYRAASELDPAFSNALTREAYANALFIDWGWSPPGGSAEPLLERGLLLTDSVLARDSTSSEAWLARGYLLVQRDPYTMEGALAAFERAILLDPVNAELYHQYGQTLMALGRFGEASAVYHNALALDPTRAMTLVPLSGIASRAGDHAEALRWADSAVSVGPSVPYARVVRSAVRLRAGDVPGAVEDAEGALRIDPSYAGPARSALAAARFALGDTASARREIERAYGSLADPGRPSPTDALYLAGALVGLDRRDEALDLLHRAQPRGAWLWFYLSAPVFDPIRADLRFQALERETDPRGG